MGIMYKLVFSLIELLSVRGYRYSGLRAKSKKKLKRHGEKKIGPTKQDIFYWSMLHMYSYSKYVLRS